VIIEAAAEAMHSGVVALDSEVAHIDGGSSSCIDIRDSYVSVSGLALEGTGAAHNIFVFGASDGGVEVDKIVTNGRSNSVHFQNSGSGNHLRNSIVHDTALGLRANGAGCHVLAQNNTIHGGTDGALNTINNGRITEDNNYLTTDLGEPIYQTGTGGTIASGLNTACSNEARTPSLGNVAFNNDNFVDLSASPKNLLITSSSFLIDKGADLSGLGVVDDILGNTRIGVTFDIGAHEFTAESADDGFRLWLFF
jgi:hypothetical protein